MNKGGFFERMMGVKADEDSLARAVREHLGLLLNTRQGSILHLPDYGLPDLSIVYSEYPDSVEFLRRSIKNTIEKYEPRLQNIRVEEQSYDNMVFEITFKISANIYEEENTSEIQFLTTISNTGRANLSS